MTALLTVGLVACLLLGFVGLTLILRGLELAFPRFSAWLDARFGPDDGSGW